MGFWLLSEAIQSESRELEIRVRCAAGGERRRQKETIDQAKLQPVDTGLSPGSGMTKKRREAIFIRLCVRVRVCVCVQMDVSLCAHLHAGENRADGLLDRNALNACMQATHACSVSGKWRR